MRITFKLEMKTLDDQKEIQQQKAEKKLIQKYTDEIKQE